jgi:hypothetical protein
MNMHSKFKMFFTTAGSAIVLALSATIYDFSTSDIEPLQAVGTLSEPDSSTDYEMMMLRLHQQAKGALVKLQTATAKR